ncbi:shikimate kinase [Saccharopolyspora sp. HNM0983]|uniref:Shikimate kinase n=1 Tax=Saccharopolyspora montiporae TaxID=2781240 RepID=A0A929B9A3_9PSEU|nr:shikimate kinase [Saccharopolyspora sp. HNM0983]MBE9373407.1 shikimate kinase [Saccharopolyspora sp. HNM0983]
MAPRAVLVGPPGAGKSTIGRLLAERLGVPFRDTDEDIAGTAGKTIAEIFTEDGESAFRELEERVIATALDEHAGVLALGGGAVLSERTRQRLAGHPVVFLSVGLGEGAKRVGLSTARPLLAGVNPRATFKALLDERLPVYRGVAVVEIATDGVEPDDIADQVVQQLAAGAPRSTGGN